MAALSFSSSRVASCSATRRSGWRSVARPAAAGASRRQVKPRALFGGSGDDKQPQKFISRDEEPEEYWVSKSEKAGADPLKDPIAWIGIVSILFPFVFLLVAIAFGWIDTSVYR